MTQGHGLRSSLSEMIKFEEDKVKETMDSSLHEKTQLYNS